ncbi:MAG: hypothetical protein ACRDYU_14865, partial [Actinomycetes bacterium]
RRGLGARISGAHRRIIRTALWQAWPVAAADSPSGAPAGAHGAHEARDAWEDAGPDALGEALVAEGTKKAGLVWLTLPGSPHALPVWHVWLEGAAYVISGGEEQPLPDIERGGEVRVTVPSKDNRGRLVTWVAEATRVEPGTDEWDAAVAVLKPGRLNASDGERMPRRWAEESRLTRLAPTGRLPERPGDMPGGSLAAPPPPTPATTRGRLPYVLGRRPRRRRRT